MTQRRYFTTREVAEQLSLSPSKVQAMCSRGEIPVERFGRSIRIEVSALEAWLRNRSEAARAYATRVDRLEGER